MVGVVVAGAGAVVVAVGVAVGVVVAVAVVVGVVVVFGVAVGVVVAVAGVKSRLIRRWIGRVRQRARFGGDKPPLYSHKTWGETVFRKG